MMETALVLDEAARELEITRDELVVRGVRALIERNLRHVDAQIAEIAGRYGVRSVGEMDAEYQVGTLAENGTWRDYQNLDHLEYKRDRLQQLFGDL
jgi:hypothetical protein